MSGKSFDRRGLAIAGVALALVLLFSLNTFGALVLRPLRIDLTADEQFTLSEGTLKLLGELEEPVELRLYVSSGIREANPFLASYADRVHDLLKAYAEAANGRISVRYIDPEPFSEEEDRAVGFGLQPISLGDGTTGYFGIAGTNSTDDADVIAVLSPERERFLEFDLTRLVYNLAYPDKPVVGLVTGLPMNGDPALQYKPWQVYSQLAQQFDIRYLGGEIGSFDEDMELLLVAHPKGLSERTLYAIDQFVLGGGKLLVFVDPHSEAAALRQQRPGMEPTSSDLAELFDAWGIAFDENRVVADPSAARQVQFPSGQRQQIVDYLAWLSLDPSHLNPDQPITAELQRVNLASAGFIEKKEGAEVELVPLLISSPQAQAIDAEEVRLFPDPLKLIGDYEPGDEALYMAAVVTGRFESAFPDGPPEGAETTAEHRREAAEPVSVIVVADTDLLDDRSWLARQNLLGQEVTLPLASNADFVANALDFLAGSEVLMALRGRDVALRPFTRIIAIRREAEQRYRAKEQELLDRLSELEDKLRKLQVSDDGGAAVLSEAQQQEIENFRSQLLETRAELREVQRALRSDIENLKARIRFANIGAVPLLVGLVAIGLALVRRARYRRKVTTTTA